MDCRTAERLIIRFINDDMHKDEVESFVDHINTCEMCREELSIQYLVAEGMNRLESGGTFALQEELEDKLEQARRRAVMRKWVKRTFYALEIAAIIGIVCIAVAVILG